MEDNREKDVRNFIVNYEDGSKNVVEKGFFCEMKDSENGDCDLSFIMTGVSGRDLENIVFGCIQLGYRLGMFGKDGENNDN